MHVHHNQYTISMRFNRISFHNFSRQLSAFSLCSSGLISALLVLSTMYLYMKVSRYNPLWLTGLKASANYLTAFQNKTILFPQYKKLQNRHLITKLCCHTFTSNTRNYIFGRQRGGVVSMLCSKPIHRRQLRLLTRTETACFTQEQKQSVINSLPDKN